MTPAFLLNQSVRPMRVLGCDPGPRQSGYCVWDTEVKRILNCASIPNLELMAMIKDGQFNDCTHAACEGVTSYGSIGKDILETTKQVGRFLERLEPRFPTLEVMRPDILAWLCGDRRADKARARQRLIDLYGPVGTAKHKGPLYGCASHAWSALAICVYGEVKFKEAQQA